MVRKHITHREHIPAILAHLKTGHLIGGSHWERRQSVSWWRHLRLPLETTMMCTCLNVVVNGKTTRSHRDWKGHSAARVMSHDSALHFKCFSKISLAWRLSFLSTDGGVRSRSPPHTCYTAFG